MHEYAKIHKCNRLLDLPEDEYDHPVIVDPFLKRLFRHGKLGIVDVRVHTKSGRVIHVELQVEKNPFIRFRILFYEAKLFCEQMKRGDNWDKLNQVISIVICNHILLPEEEGYLNEYEMRNKRSGKAFTGLQKMLILELPRVPEEDDGRPVWPWLRFMKGKSEAELDELAVKKPEVGMAVAAVKELSWSERRRMIADSIEMRRRDIAGMLKGAREEGLEETALKMKQWGDPIEKISAVTGLSTERIEKL
ncbi:MAG: Rpn family recombination-promoting nuclease/putative transposase [Treponema sp.]|nr:Rpn family recombination-promoting nuclease/putative transposase [Treponema sp.]